MKDSTPAYFKMNPGSKEVDSPGVFNGKDQGVMSAFNYGTPLNNPNDKEKVEIGSGASNKLNEVVLTAKSPQTIKKQVEQNVAGAHSSAGNIRTATPEKQKEIKSGKYTTGGRRSDMTNTELKIYEKKYGAK